MLLKIKVSNKPLNNVVKIETGANLLCIFLLGFQVHFFPLHFIKKYSTLAAYCYPYKTSNKISKDKMDKILIMCFR